MRPYFVLIIFALLLSSCATPDPVIEEGMNRELYFQRAQEAYDKELYQHALFYYESFLEDFPDDQTNGIMAEYEIAFLYYKQDNYSEATKGFEKILEKYKTNPMAPYPAWPKQLSEKLLTKMADSDLAEAQE